MFRKRWSSLPSSTATHSMPPRGGRLPHHGRWLASTGRLAERLLEYCADVTNPLAHTGMHQVPVDSVVIDVPLDQAWTAPVAAYEELDLPMALRNESASQLGTRSYRVRRNRIGRARLSQYLDCG